MLYSHNMANMIPQSNLKQMNSPSEMKKIVTFCDSGDHPNTDSKRFHSQNLKSNGSLINLIEDQENRSHVQNGIKELKISSPANYSKRLSRITEKSNDFYNSIQKTDRRSASTHTVKNESNQLGIDERLHNQSVRVNFDEDFSDIAV